MPNRDGSSAPTRRDLAAARRAEFHHQRIEKAASPVAAMNAALCYLAAVATEVDETNEKKADEVAAGVVAYLVDQADKLSPSGIPARVWIDYLRRGGSAFVRSVKGSRR